MQNLCRLCGEQKAEEDLVIDLNDETSMNVSFKELIEYFCRLRLAAVCFGTYQGTLEYSNKPSNMELHYNNLRDRYTGCTYVDGNLEITSIRNDIYDLSFLQDIHQKAVINMDYIYDDVDPSCDSTCEKGCWADGPENCQKFNKNVCPPNCSQARCFGSTENECCHKFCAGGCTGPTQKDCFACRNFNDDGECNQECPAIQIKNPTNDLWEPNPDGKYAYGDICVKKCPEQTLEDNVTCVHYCPPNKMDQKGVCVSCVGCLKTCQINQIVHFRTIDIFQGCNIIEGSLDICGIDSMEIESFFLGRNNSSFDAFENNLSSIKNITGYLSIRDIQGLKDLSFLRNLEVIGGKQLDPIKNVSLLIMDTSLQSLGLKSLKSIESGAVAIVENKKLCFVEDINWNQIQKSQSPHNSIISNEYPLVCELDNQICSKECTAGCWGAGLNQCLECNFIYNGSCLATCKSLKRIYQIDMKTCGDCHQQCKESCSGPNADDCGECASVKDGEFCVSECPVSKYLENGICLNCQESCNGCNGPRNNIAADGCIDCDYVIINEDATIDKCLKKYTPD
ncbi:unnamed protein product [Diamesa hyperborea]